mmetsp:Transcript_28277/g.39807  ORF Transcript_28277/g.39807 Transcript_28277/m.39807 type:complete len:225 (+) Transcript_28277:213-887(+)
MNDGVDPPDDLKQRLLDELVGLELSIPGLLNIGDITVTPIDERSGTLGGAQTESRKNERGLGVPGWVSLGCAAAIIMLVLLLFANNKRKEKTSFIHVAFEDEDEDDALAKEIVDDEASEGNTSTATEEFNIEADWDTPVYLAEDDQDLETFITAREDRLGRTHSGMDVHVCTSAMYVTCMACERDRKRDLTFIPTGVTPEAPTRSPDLPTSSNREYAYDNTVDL